MAVDDREGQGHTHLSLAMIRGRAGRLTLALAHAERALALFRQTGHLVGEATALNSVGFTRAHLGDHWEAVASCRRAVLLLRRLGDQAGEASAWDSSRTADIDERLARLAHAQPAAV